MQAALKHYRQTHSEYLWLHILAAVVLVFTSVFWFVLPYFMIHYGKYTTNVFQQSLLLIALYTIPSIFITLHCWFINFKAALRWKKAILRNVYGGRLGSNLLRFQLWSCLPRSFIPVFLLLI